MTMDLTQSEVTQLLARVELRNEAEALKSHFVALRAQRKPFYLDAGDLERVLKFKLRRQYARQADLRRENATEAIRAVTQAAFTIHSNDAAYELEVRVGIIAALPGIGVGVASAILALAEPTSYGVIDVRAWRQLFPNAPKKPPFTISDYREYMGELRKVAQALSCTPQEIDMALWQRDVESK